MKNIKINDLTYAYSIHQKEEELPNLLMLHGFMGDHRVFDHLIDELSDFCNPITVDLPGFGESSKPSNPDRYDEQKQVEGIDKLIKTLAIGPLFLFGYSMGGRLALQMTVSSSRHVKGLILESTTCGITDPQKRKQRQQSDEKWVREIIENFDAFLSRWKELELFQSPRQTNESLVERYRKIQSEQTPKALAASLRGFGTGSMTPVCNELKQLGLPVLLLAGSADEKYQQINKYLVDKLPNATFSSVEAGHRTHLDNPSAFISELKYFIDINTFL